MNQTEQRDQILQRYVESTDPVERRELLKQWADAGGRDLIDQAVSDGLRAFRTDQDNEDTP